MKRADFLRLTGNLGLTAPFVLNGIQARAGNFLEGFDMPPKCADISDRAVVIIRLAGANDGLNCVIPINQYSTYAAIRPGIKIADSGTGAYINLDSTLSVDKQCGLNPNMLGFKSLYDQGKLAVLPGVGYPAPNYSHFASENTMFSGKDGNTNQKLEDGIFGRYLASVFPNLAGAPNSQNRDPLAIHMGSSNPNLFYGHTHEFGIEYNLTSLQSQLWATPGFAGVAVPDISEHYDLLQYITFIEQSMDVYYNRVIENFNAGSNSTITYPDTSLAKQLKTVARMLKGGSRTKIFQVTLGGFDTHVNQVVSGATHTGSHATLLANLTNSIEAFQMDLEALGLGDRVMSVTFSEFGRQVRQNANFGSDHGNISPFFVIGKPAQAGVLSSHPIIPNTGFQYDLVERKFDYRQIFATLLQDWLGSDSTTMQVAELDQFTAPELKLPILKSTAIVGSSCYVNNFTICDQTTETIKAVRVIDSNGWTYYAPAGYIGNNFMLAIQHLPTEAGGNTSSFTTEVIFSKKICDPKGDPLLHVSQSKNGSNATFVSGYYFHFNVIAGSLNGHVNIRFFPIPAYDSALNTAADAYEAQYNQPPTVLTYIASLSGPFSFPANLSRNGAGISVPYEPIPINNNGNYLGYAYRQFSMVNNLHNKGVAAVRRKDIEAITSTAPTFS